MVYKCRFKQDVHQVSHDCHNNLPQTGWLNSTDIYYLIILSTRSLKLRFLQGHTFSGFLLCIFQLLVAVSILCVCTTLVSGSVFTWSSLLCCLLFCLLIQGMKSPESAGSNLNFGSIRSLCRF